LRIADLQPHGAVYESRGFIARRKGDVYVDPDNPQDTAVFLSVQLLKPTDADSYDTAEDFKTAYQDWLSSAAGTVHEINEPGVRYKSAYVVDMDTARGLEHYVLFTKDLRHPESRLTSIPAGVIPGHGGYRLDVKTSFSERSGLKPSDIIKSHTALSPGQVPGLLDAARATAGDDAVDQMQGYLSALLQGHGQDYRIVDGAANASLHQKYLGEWASPIALITEQYSPSSLKTEIRDNLNGGHDLQGSKIEYSTSAGAVLFDSTVVTGRTDILISSKTKSGGGAPASLKGLYDALQKYKTDIDLSDPKTEKFYQVISSIMSHSAVDGVLKVAALLDIVNTSQANKISTAIASNKRDYEPDSAIADIMSDYAAGVHHPLYDPAKHALAAIARQVCQQLNDEDYTDIMRTVLNYASVVQMYFKTAVSGSDLICKGFELLWPPRFSGKILFYSGKTFSATQIKGRLGFKIGGSADTDAPDDSLSAAAPDPAIARRQAKALSQRAQQAVGRIVTPGERDTRDAAVPDEIALGRAKKS